MHGFFEKLFKSKVSLSSQVGKEAKVASTPSLTASSSRSASPQHQFLLNSPVRWTRQYDVFVCHSREDSETEEAERLVSFLEASPRNLRCFLTHRDSFPGGAIPTELCQAVQNSHIKVLLITPHFLTDEWCTFVMHQALADGPMSNRVIPLVQNLLPSQYPQELKVFSYTDLNRNPDHCYALVNRTVLQYLKDSVQNEKTLQCSNESSVNCVGDSI
uniref:TIR domain-containing adaptor protein n=1 Tax=Bostrychus sinensis TaxID=86224 RepID=A0A7L7QSE8_9TELE|nr:TIR domain-containing adaptor protein [Bostrychus sinensis]